MHRALEHGGAQLGLPLPREPLHAGRHGDRGSRHERPAGPVRHRMTLLTAALLLLGLAALGGLVLLSFVLRGHHTPKGIALVHGVLAAAGIVVLAVSWLAAGNAPRASLLLFVVAAAGGAIVLIQDLRKGRAPKLLAVGHGLVALAALALLVAFWHAQ